MVLIPFTSEWHTPDGIKHAFMSSPYSYFRF